MKTSVALDALLSEVQRLREHYAQSDEEVQSLHMDLQVRGGTMKRLEVRNGMAVKYELTEEAEERIYGLNHAFSDQGIERTACGLTVKQGVRVFALMCNVTCSECYALKVVQ